MVDQRPDVIAQRFVKGVRVNAFRRSRPQLVDIAKKTAK
jgi:hypothetical protein